MPEIEGRSVGELLLDCDHIVREVLLDTPLMDGRVMVRTWGEVVEAAGDLWKSLPESSSSARQSARRDAGELLMEQLQTMTGTLMKAARRRQWPGSGPADERLMKVCENLTAAAALLPRRRTDTRPMRPEVVADLDASKARLMHVLYVGAHGVQVALNRDLRTLVATPPSRRASLPADSLKRTRETRDRIAVFEHLAWSYVHATLPAALHGEHRPVPEPGRLAQALATWDIQAHRALAVNPTASTMMLIAQTQAHLAFASQTLLRAAAETGSIEPHQYRTRLAPALEEAQMSWVGLARTWAHLATSRGPRLAPDLVLAANETRAAMLELIHDGTGPASVGHLAATVDLTTVSQTLSLGLGASADLAYALREATTDPNVRASARGVNTLALALETRGPYGNIADEAWVRPEDHLQDRPVTLPEMLLDSLTLAAAQSAHLATRAAGAAEFGKAHGRVQTANEPDALPVSMSQHSCQRSLPAPRGIRSQSP